MKLAAECVPCPDGCGEPWCTDCQLHYADCYCPGPHSEEDSMADVLVVASKVKAIVKSKDLRTGEDFLVRLSAEVASMVEEATIKALATGRKTLKAEDLG